MHLLKKQKKNIIVFHKWKEKLRSSSRGRTKKVENMDNRQPPVSWDKMSRAVVPPPPPNAGFPLFYSSWCFGPSTTDLRGLRIASSYSHEMSAVDEGSQGSSPRPGPSPVVKEVDETTNLVPEVDEKTNSRRRVAASAVRQSSSNFLSESQPKRAFSVTEQLQQLQTCENCFVLYDIDNDGLVESRFFGDMARSLGYLCFPNEVKGFSTKDESPKSSSPKMDFATFLDWLSRLRGRHVEKAKLKRAFQLLDRKKDGHALLRDIQHAFRSLGGKGITEDQLQFLMKEEQMLDRKSLSEHDFCRLVWYEQKKR